jgi:hypothetical protein
VRLPRLRRSRNHLTLGGKKRRSHRDATTGTRAAEAPAARNPPRMPPELIMNQESESTLSNNNLRRMHAWSRAVYPSDWQDRCAVVEEYLAQLNDDAFAKLIKTPWPDIFAAAEQDWPEAFAGWKPPESATE